MNALKKAIEYKNPHQLSLLIDLGYNLKSRSEKELPFLHLAANVGCIECAKILLKNGLSINKKSSSGSTPLHRVVFARDNLDMIKFLLEHRAAVNAKDNYGKTPIQDCINNEAEVYKLLIKNGADIFVVDNNGNSFLEWIEQIGPKIEGVNEIIKLNLFQKIIKIISKIQ